MTTTVSATGDKPEIQLTARDCKGLVDPDWCPGCGDFGVLNALQRSCAELGLRPHEILTVSGLPLIHISEPTRPERISYAVFCLKKKKKKQKKKKNH